MLHWLTNGKVFNVAPIRTLEYFYFALGATSMSPGCPQTSPSEWVLGLVHKLSCAGPSTLASLITTYTYCASQSPILQGWVHSNQTQALFTAQSNTSQRPKEKQVVTSGICQLFPWFLPLSLCFCLFVLPVMRHSFFPAWAPECRSARRSSSLLSSLPVSGLYFRPYNFPTACICGTFWGEFLSVLPGLFLAVSAVATVAGICWPVTHVSSFVALCDLFLRTERNRPRPHTVVCKSVITLELQNEIPSKTGHITHFETEFSRMRIEVYFYLLVFSDPSSWWLCMHVVTLCLCECVFSELVSVIDSLIFYLV